MLSILNVKEALMRKNTTYGSVSMTTIKQTPVWLAAAVDGYVPKEILSKTIKQALVSLGWDLDKEGYTREIEANIRSNLSNELIYVVDVYRFPVKDDCVFKSLYEKTEVLHYGQETISGNNRYIRLKDFGNEEQPPTEGFSDILDGEV